MEKIRTKHFQYTGTDDYDQALDEQINLFLEQQSIAPEELIDIKYSGHTTEGVNVYSALVVYYVSQ